MDDESGNKMVEILKSPPCERHRRGKSPAKEIASISSGSMDQQIWKDLPKDPLEAVVARVPTESFFRFRTVCKDWNSLVSSPTFAQHLAEASVLHPWFYSVTYGNTREGTMYNPSLKKWYHISIPFFLPAESVLHPLASAGGLICSLDLKHKNFYVSNPLTKSFKKLPPVSCQPPWSRAAFAMILNGKTAVSGYKIMWLGYNGDHEIYDSIHNSWSRSAGFPPTIKLQCPLNFRPRTAMSAGRTVYFMHVNPDGILLYDMGTGIWKQYLIPSPLHLTDHMLSEYEGQILLVGLVTENDAPCVCIWEMQKMPLLWKEIGRMPNTLFPEPYGRDIMMTCLGSHGLLMLSWKSQQMRHWVMYNLSTKEWQTVPACTCPHCERAGQTIIWGTAFLPCPTALA